MQRVFKPRVEGDAESVGEAKAIARRWMAGEDVDDDDCQHGS